MSRRRIWLVAAAAALGWWLFENASLPRLRATFVPWMHRLERYRDALETTRNALRRRDVGAAVEPEGIAALRAWAWKDLDRVAIVSFDAGKAAPSAGISDRACAGFMLSAGAAHRDDPVR